MSEGTVVLKVDSKQAEASFARFVQGSEKAIAAVRPLERGMQANFDSASATAGLKNLSAEAQNTYSVLTQITKTAAMIFAGSKSVGFFTSAVREAASHSEDLAQFEHVFRNVRDEAATMAKTLQSDVFGRTEREAMQLTMGMGSLLKGIGLTDQAAVELSGDFAKMAVDIGSFMAKDSSAVMEAMQGALMGNTMALRTYGVFLTDVQLKEKMAEQSKEGLVFATEREAKAYAILSEIQRQQADAIGDFAVESGNYRNQVDKLSKGLKELKRNIGEAFVEPATKVVQSLNSVVDWVKTLDQTTVTFIARTGGVVVGLGLASTAYRTLSPLVGSLASVTGLSSKSLVVETAALTANTTALTSNAAARKIASASQLVTPGRMSGTSATVSDARWRAAEYAFMDKATRNGSFGITGGPLDFSLASSPGRMSSSAARNFERATGIERTRTLSASDISTGLKTIGLQQSISRLSLGFKGLEGPAGRLVGVTSKLSPALGKIVSFAGPVGAAIGTVATVSSVAKSFPMQMEKMIDGMPEFTKALEKQLTKIAFEDIPNAFSTVGKGIYTWGGETAYGLQQILSRPFGPTDTTNLHNSQKAVDRMLGQDMGRLNSKGEKMTLADVVEENRIKYGESSAERERKRIETRDEQYNKLTDALPSYQEDMKKGLASSDKQYRIGQMSGGDQLKVFEKQLTGVERQIKLFSDGNKDFIIGLGKSSEELEKWSKDLIKERDKIRSKIDDAWKLIESEEKTESDKWAADDKKRFDRLSKDDQYAELSKKLKEELDFQKQYITTETGKKMSQTKIDDLQYKMQPYEKEMRERADKASEMLFDFEFNNASMSDKKKMLDNATKDYMSQVGGLLNNLNVSSSDIDKASGLLSKVQGHQSQLNSMEKQGPKTALVEDRSMQAIESGSVQARQLESRSWNTNTGQKKVEKDTSEIAKYMKKLYELTNKKTKSKSDNSITLDD